MNDIYWVVSRDCNQHCGHCYNDSKPDAPGLTLDEVTRVVANLPDPARVPLGRIALSGGEPLVWPELLFHTLGLLRDKYGSSDTLLAVQSNGDLLDGEMLDKLMSYGVHRMSISSFDKYHLPQSMERRGYLEELYKSRGFEIYEFTGGGGTGGAVDPSKPHVSFWGATEDLWIGPLWPRGRAEKNGLSKATHETRFCEHGSGAKHFLDYDRPECSVSIQLGDLYPCCAMTCRPIGNLLNEPLIDVLDRCAKHPVFRALNEGRPEKMAETVGLTETFGHARSEALGNHCLWCDEFFVQHAPELLEQKAPTARDGYELTIRGRRIARKQREAVVG